MKKTILTLGCTLLAPLAFAQTTATKETTTTTTTTNAAPVVPVPVARTTETTTTSTAVAPVVPAARTETTTTVTSTDGTVSTFEPGRSIVVRRVGVTDPISYALGKTVQYVDRAGRAIESSLIRPGVPVHVYYDNAGSSQVVSRVVVDQ